MKTLALVFVSLVMTSSAFGLAAKFNSPQIGHGPLENKGDQEKVYAILAYLQKEVTFIEGSFFNEYTNQRFGGSSKATGQLIKLIRETNIWDVQVVFLDFQEQDTAFRLSQVGGKQMTITVNSGRDDFLLQDFRAALPGPGMGSLLPAVAPAPSATPAAPAKPAPATE